ncbi:Transcription factor spt8 [Penicillium sp. IBT 35674x]|nr:Transcription factor spt8 [Penicillium sp. IBT 35674x]
MPSIDEDDDRDLAGSQDGSSDNENDIDDSMRDVDDADADGDGDNDNDNDNENEPDGDADADADGDQDPDSPSNASQTSEGGMNSQPNQERTMSSGNGHTSMADSFSIYHPSVRPECLTASTYDIAPTTAAPHSTSINAITATADMRWVFTGGSDGYTRKFNWADSINSKLMLTVAQRHPFVDSVVKAGVLMTYWENMDGNSLSSVYSLACQSEGLWLLSGLESGAIRLQTLRHDEGREIVQLRQHTSAVSCLSLTSDEKSLLSGSWDKRVFDWDLNTGQARRAFGGSAGQISTVQIRPESSLAVPQDTAEPYLSNGTYSSNYQARETGTFNTSGAAEDAGDSGAAENPQAGSPADSLFGGADSLFGDGDGGAGDGGSLPAAYAPGEIDTDMPQSETNHQPDAAPAEANDAVNGPQLTNGHIDTDMSGTEAHPLTNGSPRAEELESFPEHDPPQTMPSEQNGSGTDNTFLAASMDGAIRVWDRRQPDPVARISPHNVPPWWRRNGTVEEYSLHKGLRQAERTFKFPQGSGPVTALKAMPNGRHLVCASHDILRLYDLQHDQSSRHTTPFLIIPGHRTGTISQLYLDNACRFMISTSGNRGWEGNATEVLLGYEIGVPQ